VMPTTFVLAFSVSQRVESFLLIAGAESATYGHCRAIASASSISSVVTVAICR
jgi:hypothetical protein